MAAILTPAPVVADENTSPVVDALQKLDEEYIVKQSEMNRKMREMRAAFTADVAPLLKKRQETLRGESKGEDKATPALPGFWLRVLDNSEEFQGLIEEHDRPVLEYLDDIRCENLVEEDDEQGFRIIFTFVANPYFENTTITKEVLVSKTLEYVDHIEIEEISCDELKWKSGMDVTVEVVKKKRTGGGKKKAPASSTIPRDSLFRFFFRSLGGDHPVPNDYAGEDDEDDEEEDEDDDERLQMYLSQDYELCVALRDFIVPHAVKWFTGEAVEDDDDYDEDDDEDDDDYDDEEDEEDEESEDEEDEGRPINKGGKGGKKQEDCKQQ